MERIKEIIDKYSTGKIVLSLVILAYVVFAFMLLVTIPKVMTFSNGMKLLDMMPMGYDSDYIYSLFKALGEDGRQVYLYKQLPVDMIYPFLFGISNCLLIGYILKKLNKLSSVFFYLCFLPLIGGVADYLENFGIITMLNNYPDLSQWSMNTTNIFSIMKSSTTTVFFVVLIISLLILGIKFFRERKSRSSTM